MKIGPIFKSKEIIKKINLILPNTSQRIDIITKNVGKLWKNIIRICFRRFRKGNLEKYLNILD